MTEMRLCGRGILSIRQLQTLATLSSGILKEERELQFNKYRDVNCYLQFPENLKREKEKAKHGRKVKIRIYSG